MTITLMQAFEATQDRKAAIGCPAGEIRLGAEEGAALLSGFDLDMEEVGQITMAISTWILIHLSSANMVGSALSAAYVEGLAHGLLYERMRAREDA